MRGPDLRTWVGALFGAVILSVAGASNLVIAAFLVFMLGAYVAWFGIAVARDIRAYRRGEPSALAEWKRVLGK